MSLGDGVSVGSFLLGTLYTVEGGGWKGAARREGARVRTPGPEQNIDTHFVSANIAPRMHALDTLASNGSQTIHHRFPTGGQCQLSLSPAATHVTPQVTHP